MMIYVHTFAVGTGQYPDVELGNVERFLFLSLKQLLQPGKLKHQAGNLTTLISNSVSLFSGDLEENTTHKWDIFCIIVCSRPTIDAPIINALVPYITPFHS